MSERGKKPIYDRLSTLERRFVLKMLSDILPDAFRRAGILKRSVRRPGHTGMNRMPGRTAIVARRGIAVHRNAPANLGLRVPKRLENLDQMLFGGKLCVRGRH